MLSITIICRRKLFWHYVIGLNLLLIVVIIIRSQLTVPNTKIKKHKQIVKNINATGTNVHKQYFDVNDSTKYILLWTNPKYFPFSYFGEGSFTFINKNCKYTNCYVTANRNFLGSYVEFDVVAFNGPQISEIVFNRDYPRYRSPHQKYVYANIESAENYPVRSQRFNNYFNWTWTYKLNSDAVWGYFVVKDATGKVIGPSDNIDWINIDEMDDIDDELKNSLQSKKEVAVWFASNCLTQSLRENYIKKIQHYLDDYNLVVDTFGDCGRSQCPKEIMVNCFHMIRKKYYFYFAFENAFSDDYVTEKVLNALIYDTVPVVYGGANYSKFLPDGTYLDAVKLGPKNLAKTMYEIMQDKSKYYKFFRWKKYYSFHYKHELPETDDYCKFCGMLHNETLVRSHSVYENFTGWWMENVDRNKAYLLDIDDT